MTPLHQPFQTIEDIVDQTTGILSDFKSIPNFFDTTCQTYLDTCKRIPAIIQSGQLKIAVVGVIKSGKSTFVNALVGKELVKRGAGVITSMTTRIKKGKRNCAVIKFKSWDQINAQIENAIQLFPTDDLPGDLDSDLPAPFDLRRKNDRMILKSIYHKMMSGFPLKDGKILPETLMIRHALQGYDRCSEMVKADESSIQLKGSEFDKHKAFTSDADRAFFVRDVCLEVFGKRIDPDLEIADCQGADSTDPTSLDQVLKYIETANVIVYCISSRNGLRQSDIMFLSKMKALGLLDQVLVINNCDLTEHDHIDDLKKIASSIEQDLEIFGSGIRVFSFSFLYHLYEQLGSKLSKKAKANLSLWQDEKKMLAFCLDQNKQFFSLFNTIVQTSRNQYLVSVHLNRLNMVLSSLKQKIDFGIDLLSSDQDQKQQIQQQLEKQAQDALRLELIVTNSIDSAVQGLEKEVKSQLDLFFARDEQKILENTRRFVDQTDVDPEPYRKTGSDNGFNQILYLLFQDFRRKLDGYVIENVKPKIRKLVTAQDKTIQAHFQSLLSSCRMDSIAPGIRSNIENNDLQSYFDQTDDPAFDEIDLLRIKDITGIKMPEQVFQAVYTRGAKTGVFIEFTKHVLSGILKAVTNKTQSFSFSPGLEQAGKKMKLVTRRQLGDQFETYKIRLTNEYVDPLITASTREFRRIIDQRFKAYRSVKKETDRVFKMDEEQKAGYRQTALMLQKRIDKVITLTDGLKQSLSQELQHKD